MRATVSILGVLLLAMVAACSTSQANPAPSVPTVGDNPLDLSKAATAPCRLLNADRLAQYDITSPGVVTSTPAGPACTWQPTLAAQPSYQAGVDLHSGGLAGLYGRRNTIPLFQPTLVSEYPAVHVATNRTAQQHGQCSVDVGVANDTLLIVSVTISGTRDPNHTTPCLAADAFAASVVGYAASGVP